MSQVLIGLATLWSPPAVSSSPLAPAGAKAAQDDAERHHWRRVRLRALQLTAAQLRALASASAADVTPSSSSVGRLRSRAASAKKQASDDIDTATASSGGAVPAVVSAVACASEQLMLLLLPIASGADVLLAAAAIDCVRALVAAHTCAFGPSPAVTTSEPRRDAVRPVTVGSVTGENLLSV